MNTTIVRRLTRGVTAGVAVAGLLTAGLVAAAPAYALSGLTRVSATSVRDTAATKTVQAACPTGMVPLGGGGVPHPTRPQDVKIRAAGVHLTDTGSYYAVTADVASDPELVGPWDLTVSAVCAPQPSGYEIRSSYSPFSPGGFKGLSAQCSAGKKVLSVGGFVYRLGGVAAPELTLNGFSFVGDNGASMAAQTWRYGFSGNWMDELDLVCAEPPSGYTKLQNTLTVPGNITDHAVHGVGSGVCPPGAGVVGLGAAVGTVGQHVQPIAIDLQPGIAIVQGVADTEGEATNWSMTVQAICLT